MCFFIFKHALLLVMLHLLKSTVLIYEHVVNKTTDDFLWSTYESGVHVACVFKTQELDPILLQFG